MRRRRTPTRSLRGQLLFVDIAGDTATLDCVLAGDAEQVSGPVTLTVQFSDGVPPRPAQRVLEKWARDGSTIAVTIVEGRWGPEVEIVSSAARLVLHPGASDWD